MKNRAPNGNRNLAGEKIKYLRKQLKGNISQREFAEMLQRSGLDFHKNVVSEIELGKRVISDIELVTIARVFDVTVDELLKSE